jgi:murein DD-endopeptidase MepM/ murein hydrolase activator NlpD
MRRTVLLSLMYQNDTAPETLKLVAMQLRNGNAGIRDVACEYLRYYGLPEHKKELEQRLRIDPDRYVRASAAAAIEAIDRREQRFKVEGEALAPPEPGEGQSRMQAWARRLREQPTRKMKAGALEALGKELPVSLYLRYGGRDNQPPRQVLEAHHAWTVLLNLAVGSDPSRAGSILHRSRTRRGGERPEAPEPDEARRFIPPLRGYFDPRRRSFARRIGSGSGPFSGSVHVGDDCGAHQEQTPVVAIADGTVRYLSISGLSWGSIVVLEHVLPDKTRFCSLYAHLGPVPCVALGQKVRAGQKLGSLARAFTFDNGGYFTHLHFGIHQGPYAEGQWITGYVDPKRFAKDQAGWVDPQQFLRARIAGR